MEITQKKYINTLLVPIALSLDRAAKKRNKHVEYNQRGIFIPAVLLDGCGFEQGYK